MEEVVDVEGISKISFSFEGFEGPLDLLLQLISERNISVKDVKLAEITDQYLKRIQGIEEIDMEEASAFLEMASRLLLIKSKSLLPKDELIEADEDPIDDETKLKMQLEEYQLFKEASLNLQPLENINRFYKQPDKTAGDARIIFKNFDLEKLLDAFAFILMKTKDREGPEEKKINRDRWTVADKIAFINSILKDNKQINFFSLFDNTYSKLEIITVFLALLELLKFQKIEVVQADRYEDILIKRKEREDES